jgi:hypothetical protein
VKAEAGKIPNKVQNKLKGGTGGTKILTEGGKRKTDRYVLSSLLCALARTVKLSPSVCKWESTTMSIIQY